MVWCAEILDCTTKSIVLCFVLVEIRDDCRCFILYLFCKGKHLTVYRFIHVSTRIHSFSRPPPTQPSALPKKSQTLPPLLPKVDAILVLDGEGHRLAGKYYGKFLSQAVGQQSREQLREAFEKALQAKIVGLASRPEAAEVVTCQGRTAVVCGGSGAANPQDVRIVHVGPLQESELVLAHLAEGMYEALHQLMGGAVNRTMVLDNLELVFLLIDEHCDGGLILEVDPTKLAGAVLLRDEDVGGGDGMGPTMGAQVQGLPPGVSPEMSLSQAFAGFGRQLMSNLNSQNGM